MTRLEHLFTDALSGRDVYCFRDAFGRRWMAERRWSLFRARLPKGIAG